MLTGLAHLASTPTSSDVAPRPKFFSRQFSSDVKFAWLASNMPVVPQALGAAVPAEPAPVNSQQEYAEDGSSMESLPQAYWVSGAGSPEVNGCYRLSGSINGYPFFVSDHLRLSGS